MIRGRLGWVGASRRTIVRHWSGSTDLVHTLQDRGLVANVTSPNLGQELSHGKKVTIYCGADPTAPSLHLGNLMPLMVLLHFHVRGHNPIAVVGGATGQVGDPSGRSTERNRIEQDAREHNIQRIQQQMGQFLDTGAKQAARHGLTQKGTIQLVNNADWWTGVGMLDFLSQYGRHIRVSQMIGRESVRARLESEQGIGFNEFSYQVLQAFDFWHLYKNHNCQVQVGGNDQWGNITAGIDLISRLSQGKRTQAYGITVPLLTTPSGEKFGKSAGNALWLDPAMTKPYEIYQHFIQTPDSLVDRYLKLFTFIPSDTIQEIVQQHNQKPEQRLAQTQLAAEVVDMIHGPGTGERQRFMSSILFNKNSAASADQILEAFGVEGMVQPLPSGLQGQVWRDVLALLINVSKSEAGRMIKGGGVYYGLDRVQVGDALESFDAKHLTEGKLLLLRTGKSNHRFFCI